MRPLGLLEEFVESGLRRADPAVCSSIVSDHYKDHSELCAAGMPALGRLRWTSKHDLIRLVEAFQSDRVCIDFRIARGFAANDSLGYHIEGAGLVTVAANLSGRTRADDDLDRLLSRLLICSGVTAPVKSVAVEYRCAGIFRVQQELLAERWGTGVLTLCVGQGYEQSGATEKGVGSNASRRQA